MDRYFAFLRYLRRRKIIDRLIYLHWRNFLNKSQWWTKEENESYQWNKTKSLLNYAYKNVPYYTELFNKIGATPEDIKEWSDFRKIPYLTKEIILERQNDLISRDIRKRSKLKSYSTGGSTGQPLVFYKFHFHDAIERAFMFHQWGRVGFKEDSKCIILRGDPVPENKLYRRYRFSNNWQLSSFHLSKSYVYQYVHFLNNIKPEFLHVHPSSLYVLTKLIVESGLSLNIKPKAIFCGSEPVYDYQRELFEKVYESRVYTWLGLAEGTTLAGECEYSKYLHVWPQYSYVELLDEKGIPVYTKGETGIIIGTSLNNHFAPLIRYKSGDLATFGSNRCEYCGRNHMIFEKIDGREQSIIFLSDGGALAAHSIPYNLKTCRAFSKIKKWQIVQKIPGEIDLNISVSGKFTLEEEEEMRSRIISLAFGKLRLQFIYTDNLIRSASGKHVFLVQEIKN
jgi:phenylacetate-CoA ligase